MKTIWEYVLKLEQCQACEVPKDGVILSAIELNNTIALYIGVEPDRVKEIRRFEMIFTGEEVKENLEQSGQLRRYIGTYKIPHGLIVHLFEILEIEFKE